MDKTVLEVRPAAPQDADKLAPRLRRADRMEVQANSGRDPRLAMREAVADSVPAYALLGPYGEVIGLFGALPHPRYKRAGSIWLLGSDELVANPLVALRTAKLWLGRMHEHYPVLGNFIDARNTLHIRWLCWLGFRMLRRVERFGAEQRPFIEFCRAQRKPYALSFSLPRSDRLA